MTKEESETPSHSGISQTDVLMQPQPQTPCVPTKQDVQSIKQTPADDKELKSFNEMEISIFQDVKIIQFGDVCDSSQSRSSNESTDTSQNRQGLSKHFASKEIKSNVPSGAVCIKDRNPACQSSDELRDMLSQLLITENSQSHGRNEIGFTHDAGSKAYKPRFNRYGKNTDVKLMVRIDDQIPKARQNKHGTILGTGPGLLPPPPVHRQCRSNVRPSNIDGNRRPDRPMLVHFVKSTGLDSSARKCFENRDIFEAGGEESLNPRLNRAPGTFRSGGDEIEYLPAETPEPQVFITPTVSVEPETRISWRVRLRAVVLLIKCCCKLFQEKLEKQFAKAPLFYLISVVMILISAIVLPRRKSDSDIFICLIVAFVVCILITIALDRGQWSKSIEKLGETPFFGWIDRETVCCGCFRGPEPEIERHSQYRRLEEDKDTIFEHEIADVSNIDPSDCPQMKMVEQQEILSPGSPDYPPDISQVNVDVHIPGTTVNSELGAISKQDIYKKSTKSHCKIKLKGSSAPLKLPKSVKADVHYAETVTNLKDVSRCEHRAEAVARDFSELSHISDASRDKFKIFREFSPQLTRTSKLEASVVETYRKGFACEHSDQGLACSCSAYTTEKTVESKREFKIHNEKPSPLPKTDYAGILTCSPETTTSSDSKTSKSEPLLLAYKNDSHKSKENLTKLSDSPLKLLQTIHVPRNDEPETSKNPKNTSSDELHTQSIESGVPEFSQ